MFKLSNDTICKNPKYLIYYCKWTKNKNIFLCYLPTGQRIHKEAKRLHIVKDDNFEYIPITNISKEINEPKVNFLFVYRRKTKRRKDENE